MPQQQTAAAWEPVAWMPPQMLRSRAVQSALRDFPPARATLLRALFARPLCSPAKGSSVAPSDYSSKPLPRCGNPGVEMSRVSSWLPLIAPAGKWLSRKLPAGHLPLPRDCVSAHGRPVYSGPVRRINLASDRGRLSRLQEEPRAGWHYQTLWSAAPWRRYEWQSSTPFTLCNLRIERTNGIR